MMILRTPNKNAPPPKDINIWAYEYDIIQKTHLAGEPLDGLGPALLPKANASLTLFSLGCLVNLGERLAVGSDVSSSTFVVSAYKTGYHICMISMDG